MHSNITKDYIGGDGFLPAGLGDGSYFELPFNGAVLQALAHRREAWFEQGPPVSAKANVMIAYYAPGVSNTTAGYGGGLFNPNEHGIADNPYMPNGLYQLTRTYDYISESVSCYASNTGGPLIGNYEMDMGPEFHTRDEYLAILTISPWKFGYPTPTIEFPWPIFTCGFFGQTYNYGDAFPVRFVVIPDGTLYPPAMSSAELEVLYQRIVNAVPLDFEYDPYGDPVPSGWISAV